MNSKKNGYGGNTGEEENKKPFKRYYITIKGFLKCG
jgi:hypothetical protein